MKRFLQMMILQFVLAIFAFGCSGNDKVEMPENPTPPPKEGPSGVGTGGENQQLQP